MKIKKNTPRFVQKLVAGRIYTFYRDVTPVSEYQKFKDLGFDIFEEESKLPFNVIDNSVEEPKAKVLEHSREELEAMTLAKIKVLYKGLYEKNMRKGDFIDKILKQ